MVKDPQHVLNELAYCCTFQTTVQGATEHLIRYILAKAGNDSPAMSEDYKIQIGQILGGDFLQRFPKAGESWENGLRVFSEGEWREILQGVLRGIPSGKSQ
ncbi:MAG: hypothetical protein HY360_05905 [Verrucomicrobia bacterium]|nr:hypothetical protein [Verrucomicrobiota bacterium]